METMTALPAESKKSSEAPVMLWVPPRGPFPECWLHTLHIVSIYYGGGKNQAFIELITGKTVELTYKTPELAQQAAKCFVMAMSSVPSSETLAAYPLPIDGHIRLP